LKRFSFIILRADLILPVTSISISFRRGQVIPRSHKLGRIDHVSIGDQTGADLERVAETLKVLPSVYVEMDPGDVLFFHSNLLHTSGQNRSEQRRWVLIAAFNQRKNNPYKEHHHPRYTPMTKVTYGNHHTLSI
jgi:ectoine hydroxylase-related dioxygenase (phytanoyl-CoA dioxygenase family)